MYFTEIDENTYAIKPMNCPGSILLYKRQLQSYRDLPLRYCELGLVHRHELSGTLHGLMRMLFSPRRCPYLHASFSDSR